VAVTKPRDHGGGAGTSADVFYGPFSDALGSLSAAGRLGALSAEQLDRLPEAYRSPDRTWAAVSGRANVVFYNTDRLSEADLPDTMREFADPAWRGSRANAPPRPAASPDRCSSRAGTGVAGPPRRR
jgi:iron(III) transport system substrate-binding protein